MGEVTLNLAVQNRAKAIYDEVALLTCHPGMLKSKMDEVVREALGGYPKWRIRAARLEEAGCFGAAAMLALEQGRDRFLLQRAADAAAAKTASRERRLSKDRDLLAAELDRLLAEVIKIRARLSELNDVDHEVEPA